MAILKFTRGSLPVFRRRFNPYGKLLAQAAACGFLVEPGLSQGDCRLVYSELADDETKQLKSDAGT